MTTSYSADMYNESQPAQDQKMGVQPSSGSGSRSGKSIPSVIGDLSEYRQYMDTPSQALWGGNGIFNQTTSILVNFFINVGAQYAGAVPHDWVGVWSTPPTPNPYGLQLWSDWLMTAILVVAGMGLLATPGQWASIWIGLARPIPGKYLVGPDAHWVWRMNPFAFKPVGAKHFITRTLLMVLVYSGIFYGVVMLIIFGMCKSDNIFAGPGASVGADPGRGRDPQCWVDPVIYTWVRAAVFTVQGIFVYPLAYCSALSVDNSPAWALRRWVAAQDKKAGKTTQMTGVQPKDSQIGEHSTTRTDV